MPDELRAAQDDLANAEKVLSRLVESIVDAASMLGNWQMVNFTGMRGGLFTDTDGHNHIDLWPTKQGLFEAVVRCRTATDKVKAALPR